MSLKFPCILALVGGCSGPPPAKEPPVPALAQTAEAAKAFEQLRRRWAGANRDERKSLENYLVQLRAAYGQQPVARQADLYLAWIALERGDFESAHALAAQAGGPHPGQVRLLAQLVDGVTLQRSGESEAALERLLPLVGQLIDVYARDLLHEEAVVAALSAAQWERALWLLDVWLRDVPEDDRQAVLEAVRGLVTQIPPEPVERTLGQHLSSGDPTLRAEALDKALARQLAQMAREKQDSALARRLLQQQGILPLLGEEAAALLELAARFDVPQVNGRQVGIFVADDTPELSERGAQLTLGALEELGALGGLASAGPVTGAVRQAHDAAAEQALAALDTEGVSVLVGGLHPESAERLAAFAESHGVAALLLTPPRDSKPRHWAFLFGPSEASAAPVLLEALGKLGSQQVAVVGATLPPSGSPRVVASVPCAGLPAPDQLRRYPIDEWRSRGVDALLLLGSARCAGDVVAEAREARLSVRFALGPSAAELLLPPPRGSSPTRRPPSAATAVQLGCYPALTVREGAAGYLRMLGREAARAAAAAMAGLPDDHTLEDREVRLRRERVRAALEATGPSACLGLRPRFDTGPPPWRIIESRTYPQAP